MGKTHSNARLLILNPAFGILNAGFGSVNSALAFLAIWLPVAFALLPTESMSSDQIESRPKFCGTVTDPLRSPIARTRETIGGKYLTSKGTIRALLVFASFPDDSIPHPYWPLHSPPLFMDQFIDPDTSAHSQSPFNLTHYFRQMSLGQFNFIGDAIWVEGKHSQEEYNNGSYGRANWAILQERVDSLVDFSQYDQWTRVSDYSHTNVPDGTVDMIIMVWRTTMYAYLGEASLGYKPTIVADGVKIEMGFPEYYPYPLGSGVTCEYPYGDTPSKVMQTMAHEVGHWLLGGPHPYNGLTLAGKHQFWGILCAGERISSCANAYERERLGWISIPTIEPDQDISLADFVLTGAACKYHPPNGEQDEYFYLENHQQLSVFDDVTRNPLDKGIWILHQEGPYMELDNLRIEPSDGRWSWLNPGTSRDCFSAELPVFTRGAPRVSGGDSHRDQIPNRTSAINWMHVYRDPVGAVTCGTFFGGELFNGAFSAETSTVFSPSSNPSSRSWNNGPTTFCAEIMDQENNVITVRRSGNPLLASPARRYLGADPTATDSSRGGISVAWGGQWTEGQPLESDVVWSELERKNGPTGEWSKVYEGPVSSWKDESCIVDSTSGSFVFFRARVRDAQGRYSNWSNTFPVPVAIVSHADGEPGSDPARPGQFLLHQNFPNPFNPTTTIRFAIPVGGYNHTSLQVYDLLGREVATLVNEKKDAGVHTVEFAAGDLPSGVYIYRLRAGGCVIARKMLLMK